MKETMPPDEKPAALALFSSEGRRPENFQEILLAITKHGPMIKNEIAKSIGKREGDVSKRVDWLKENGYVAVSKKREKRTKYRTIRLNEYGLTVKGVFAISHRQGFDPVGVMKAYGVPGIVVDLAAAFGPDRLRLYVNKVGNVAKAAIDGSPDFEFMQPDDPSLLGQLLVHGLKELPVLLGKDGLSEETKSKLQQVFVTYADQITAFLDAQVRQMQSGVDGLKMLADSLREAKSNPSKLTELFGSAGPS